MDPAVSVPVVWDGCPAVPGVECRVFSIPVSLPALTPTHLLIKRRYRFICIAAIGNVILVATPCVEAHKYAVGTLTPEFFHKLQVWKARWVGGGWVVIALVQGGMKYKSVWSVLWTLLVDVLYL